VPGSECASWECLCSYLVHTQVLSQLDASVYVLSLHPEKASNVVYNIILLEDTTLKLSRQERLVILIAFSSVYLI
jgi:hypothetical protein